MRFRPSFAYCLAIALALAIVSASAAFGPTTARCAAAQAGARPAADPPGWRQVALDLRGRARPFVAWARIASALPVRTLWLLSGLADAGGDAGRSLRQDTLWLQAGSGTAGTTFRDGSDLAPPHWTGSYPSIGDPFAGRVDGNAPDRNGFTFDLGR